MLGIISEEEFNKSINDSKNAPSLIRIKNNRTNVQRGDNTGLSIKKVIADESIETGDVKNTARTFGVSEKSVDSYKVGKTTSGNEFIDKDLESFVKSRKNRIADIALGKLEIAAETLTEEKIAAASLREASSLMKDMASVVRDMTAKDDDGKNQLAVQFVLHAPDIKKLEDYEVIDLNESNE